MALLALTFILLIVVFLITAIPLNISVKILGGNSSIVWAAIANLIAGICAAFIYIFLARYAALISFIALLLVYKLMFSLGWIRAFLAWILQGVIGLLLIWLLIMLGAMVF